VRARGVVATDPSGRSSTLGMGCFPGTEYIDGDNGEFSDDLGTLFGRR